MWGVPIPVYPRAEAAWYAILRHGLGESRQVSAVLDSGDFDQLVARALARIPSRFRKRLDNVVLVVEREPPRPGLLGLYHGRPLTRRSVGESFGFPDQITIYQGPHERAALSAAHLEEMVYETVWHEIAHYFGMDETQVRRAERRRGHGGVRS